MLHAHECCAGDDGADRQHGCQCCVCCSFWNGRHGMGTVCGCGLVTPCRPLDRSGFDECRAHHTALWYVLYTLSHHSTSAFQHKIYVHPAPLVDLNFTHAGPLSLWARCWASWQGHWCVHLFDLIRPQHQQFPQIPDCLSLLMALTLTHLRCPLAETSHATMHMPCTGCADGHVCSVKNRCCCGSAAFAATSARTCAHKVWYTTHQVRSTVLQRL